jgi:hypothetical protein
MSRFLGLVAAAGVCILAFPAAALAQSTPSVPDSIDACFSHWFDRVNQAQSTQPRWMTPLATVTPRLEEEGRYDQFWQHLVNGGSLQNYDGGKELELIPIMTNEVILNLPPYEERQVGRTHTSGWGDWSFLLIKQRLLSANQQNGNDILTAFFAVQAPVGISAYTLNTWVVTPTIVGGKGWGDFDIQATIGAAIPTSHQNTLGTQLVTNIALQYHLLRYFWPEFELNDTIWLNGSQPGGKNQLFLTPGLVLDRFTLLGRLRASIGFGTQFAVSPTEQLRPALNPVYDYNRILSARLSFRPPTHVRPRTRSYSFRQMAGPWDWVSMQSGRLPARRE